MNVPPCEKPDPKQCILASKNRVYSLHELNLVRLGEVYEYATFISVEKEDIEGFERHMSILKTYYDEFK